MFYKTRFGRVTFNCHIRKRFFYMQNIPAVFVSGALIDKIAVGGDIERSYSQVGSRFTQGFLNFLQAPEIKFTFLSFAVGVLGRIKSALRRREISQGVCQNFFGGIGVKFIAGGLESFDINRG